MATECFFGVPGEADESQLLPKGMSKQVSVHGGGIFCLVLNNLMQ